MVRVLVMCDFKGSTQMERPQMFEETLRERQSQDHGTVLAEGRGTSQVWTSSPSRRAWIEVEVLQCATM